MAGNKEGSKVGATVNRTLNTCIILPHQCHHHHPCHYCSQKQDEVVCCHCCQQNKFPLGLASFLTSSQFNVCSMWECLTEPKTSAYFLSAREAGRVFMLLITNCVSAASPSFHTLLCDASSGTLQTKFSLILLSVASSSSS